MSNKKYNERMREVIRARKAEDRREKEHLENSREYEPLQTGYAPERG